MKVEVTVLGSPSPNNPYGLCGRKATFSLELRYHKELCESRGDRPGRSPRPSYSSLWSLWTFQADMSAWNVHRYSGACVKVEVTVLGSPSLIILMVSVDVPS